MQKVMVFITIIFFERQKICTSTQVTQNHILPPSHNIKILYWMGRFIVVQIRCTIKHHIQSQVVILWVGGSRWRFIKFTQIKKKEKKKKWKESRWEGVGGGGAAAGEPRHGADEDGGGRRGPNFQPHHATNSPLPAYATCVGER